MRANHHAERQRGGWILCYSLIFVVFGCRGPSLDVAAVYEAVERLEDRRIDSGATPIPSELMELADHYAVTVESEDPRHLAVLLNVGEDALTARLHAIRAARRSVDLQVYIWALDDSGLLVYREVIRAARRGVKVRLLIDQLANSGVDQSAEIALDHCNIEVQLYNPVTETTELEGGDLAVEALTSFDRLNQRMHNKVLIVDGVVAIAGGRNIDDSYFDLDPDFCYIDRDLLVAGPVIEKAQESFDAYWDHPITLPLVERYAVGSRILELDADGATNRMALPDSLEVESLDSVDWIDRRAGQRTLREVLPHSRRHEVGKVEFFADPPKKPYRVAGKSLEIAEGDPQSLELEVRQSLILQSNYLVFSRETLHGLQEILEQASEPEVAYLTNSLASTANLLTYSGSRKQRLNLLYNGLDVREMCPVPQDLRHFIPRIQELVAERGATNGEEGGDPGFPEVAIHAKSLCVDDEYALVGSHNFDPRSVVYNTESFFVVHDTELTRELADEIRLLMAPGNSWICQPSERFPVWSEVNDVAAAISRALPIFDIWPWFGYQCYELREGREYVPPGHPDFYEHYRGVGQFPETESTSKKTKTWFLTTFIASFRTLL